MIKEKWKNFSLAEQMGNIGSEIFRVNGWKAAGDEQNKEKAAWRALELIDLTLADERWAGRRKEIVRLREIFCDLFLEKDFYQIPQRAFEDYFLNFALRARAKP